MFSDSGIIVELKTRKAIIMTKDFNLVKTKRKPYMAIGQKVNLSDLEISEGNGVQPAALMKGLVAVAAIEIITIIIGFNHIYNRDETFAYVSLDINPSLELRIDDSCKVITANPLNLDSKKIIENLELERVLLSDALNKIIVRSQELGYINNKSNMPTYKTLLISWTLKTNTENALKKDALKSQLDSFCTSLERKTINTRIIALDKKDKESADEYGISLGRYYILMKAKEKAPYLLIQDIKEKPISDLLNAIGEIDFESENTNNDSKDTPTETPATNSPLVTSSVNSVVTDINTAEPKTPTPVTPLTTISKTLTPAIKLTPASVSTPTPAPTPIGLSLWYKFDKPEIAYDSSDNGIAGNTVDSPQKVDGIAGNGIFLDGVNDYIECGTSGLLQPSSISVSFWLQRTESWNGKEKMFFWAKPSGEYTGNGWFITINDTGEQKYSILMCVDGLNHFYVKEEPDNFFPLNTWVHLVLTFDSETNDCKIYKSGEIQPVSLFGTPDSITSTQDEKYLGYNSPGYNSSFMNGKLDEFRIYKRVLTQDEVKDLANLKQ